MEKKYRLLEDDTVLVDGRTLYRIIALRDFADVKTGDKGGYVESENNLSQSCDSWVYNDAKVYDDAVVYGDAKVYGDAVICGDAEISDKAGYYVSKNIWSSGRYITFTRSNKMWRVGCFHGTGEELIKKAYKDGAVSGREYKRVVEYVEAMYADLESDKRK